MPRFVLLGGQVAFIHGVLVRPFEEFELPDGEAPPKMARELAPDEPAPTPDPAPSNVMTMHEIQVGGRTAARASDDEPISA